MIIGKLKNLLLVILIVLTVYSHVDGILIGHWELDVGDSPAAGQTPDASGNGNHGQLSTPAPTFGAGIISNAAYFDFNQYVEVPNTGSLTLGTGDFTLSWWMMPYNNDLAEICAVDKMNGAGGSGDTGFSLYMPIVGVPVENTRAFNLHRPGGWGTSWGNFSITPNEWMHVALVRSGTDFTAYINGVELSTRVSPGGYSLNDAGVALTFGRRNLASGQSSIRLDGRLDDVRVYSHALTENEINALSDEAPPDETPCYWPYFKADINEDCSIDMLDFAALANDWLLIGSAAETPCTGNLSVCGDLTLLPQGEATQQSPAYPSGNLLFTGSSWDSGSASAIDLNCTIGLKTFGGHSYVFEMIDAFGFPAMRFLDQVGLGKEFYFQNNEVGGPLMFNLRNEQAEEISLKFSSGSRPNPWTIGVPGGAANNMFAIHRYDLLTAMLFDEDGRILVGYLDPDPPANAPVRARLEIRGLLDETQLLVTGSSAQNAPIMKVCAYDNSIHYMDISESGNMWLGYSSTGNPHPSNILTVQQNSPTDPIADAWTVYSSRRWKTNIEPIENALDKVQQLRGVSFDWKADGKGDIGLIAEEVGEVIPEVVAYEENEKEATSVDYARLVSVLVEAVKQQQADFEKQQTEIDRQQTEINRLLLIAKRKKLLDSTEEMDITLPANKQLLNK